MTVGPGAVVRPVPGSRPWVADLPPGVPADYPMPDVPLTRLLEDAVRDLPDGVAVRDPGGPRRRGRERTWRAVDATADAVAERLRARGVGPGARVVAVLGTHPDALGAAAAVWRLGAALVPLPGDADADRVRAAVRDQGAVTALVLLDGDAAGAPPVATPDPDWVVVASEASSRWRRLRSPLGRSSRGRDGAAGLDAGPGAAPTHRRPDAALPDVPAVVAPGLDDVEVMTHRELVAAAFQARLWVPDAQAGRERVVCTDPWADAARLALGPLLALLTAGTLVVVAPDDLGTAVDRTRGTIAVLTPGEVRRLAARARGARHDLRALRVVAVVGSTLPLAAAADLAAVSGGARVRAVLAPVEGRPATHAQPIYGRVTPGSVGVPLTGTDAWVADAADVGVPLVATTGGGRREGGGGDVAHGRLVVEGPQVGPGPRTTGLVATVGPDGTFTVHGSPDVLLRRDPPCGPGALEAVLEARADVERAAVVPTDGGTVALLVGPRRARPDGATLAAYLRTRVEAVVVPDRVRWVEAIPTTVTDDVDRAAAAVLAADDGPTREERS